MDKNGNGKIDNQTELFGNTATYANGFLNLKQYDSNNDNKMTSADAQWNTLRVWVDADGDAVTDAGELKTLSSLNITQINLNATILTNVFDNENEVGATGTFVMNGQTRQVNDVWFRVDQTSSRYMADVTLDVRTLFLPTLKGFGNLKDLHVAMSQDTTLLTMMQNFVSTTTTLSMANSAALDLSIRNILFKWAGVDIIPADATTQGLNTQTMLFLERITGYKTSLLNNVPLDQNTSWQAASTQSIMLSNIIQDLKARLLVQTLGSQLFENANYNLATGDYSSNPVLSIAGLAKISSDLNGITDSYTKSQYWNGLNIFLWNLKSLPDYTQNEIDGLNAIWAIKGIYAGTWYDYSHAYSSQLAWSFNGSDLSDYLVGVDNATIRIWGNAGNDTIQGGQFGDSLQGNDGDDTINGGDGDDALYGGAGNDTYKIDYNNGIDIIQDDLGYDTVEFGAGFQASQFSTRHKVSNGNTMEMLFDGQVVASIINFYSYTNNIEKIIFADGSFIELDKIVNVINGTSRNDGLIGHAGIDEFHGDIGNDFMSGRLGDDVYIFNIGDGQDTISENGNGIDNIVMGIGITASNIRFAKSGGGADLYIYYGTSDKITINDQFYADYNPTVLNKNYNEIEFLKLTDGTAYSLMGNLTFTGTIGNDSVYGTIRSDSLIGLSGTDSLYGADGNDTLYGGTGNDILSGGGGNDTYSFTIGDGQDNISEQSGTDTILMGTGITALNVRFERSSTDLNIYYGSSDKIKIGNHFYDDNAGTNSYDEVETLRFADGSTINLKGGLTFTGTDLGNSIQGTSMGDTLFGLVGNDTLNSFSGDDILNGGIGNDYLNGGDGVDTAIYTGLFANYTISGTGTITIRDNVGTDGIDTVTGVEKFVFSNGTYENGIFTGLQANRVPVLGKDNVTVNQNNSVVINALANDSDANGDILTVSSVSVPSHGTAIINANNTVTYTPSADYYGSDNFLYTVNDGQGGIARQRINIMVNQVVAVNQVPVAGVDSATVSQNSSVIVNVLANDSDANGDTLTVSSVGLASHGTAVINANNTVTYTPTLNYSGSDSFTYSINDGHDGFASQTVNITVNAIANAVPVLGKDNATVNKGNSVAIAVLSNDSDANGDILTVSSVSVPSHGTAIINANNTVTYTPSADYYGSDNFLYTVNDGHGGIANQAVNITVNAIANTLSVLGKDNATVNEDNSVNIAVLANDSDADGDILTVTSVSTPSHGTAIINANNIVTYTPSADYYGSESFLYTVNDGRGGIATQRVNITVNSIPDAQIEGTNNAEVLTGTTASETIAGLGGTDTLYGGDGNDTLYGGYGADILYGQGGADIFVFDRNSAFSTVDSIKDFSTSIGDKIDVKDLLIGYDPVTKAIADFVEFSTIGANTVIKIDRDGTGTTYGWQQIAQADNVTGLTDEAALRASGNLIAV